MKQTQLPPIRPMVPEDRCMVEPFFDQMSTHTREFFNENDCNRNGLLACFDPEHYGKFAFGVRRNFIAVAPDDQGQDQIAGLVFAWDLDLKTPSIGVCVAENWKGRHLGKKLMEYIMDYCAQLHKGAIFLTVHPANTAAQSLYRSCGFRHIGKEHNGDLLFCLPFPDTPPAEDGTL